MHIPDNYLSPSTCITLGAAMLPVWARAARKVKEELSRKRIPLLGVGAAFSFLIMMFNLPLPGGTTGHAVGAVLVALLLGPYSATIAVTIALLIQAVFFGDGGILAFGANAFNMAFVMPFTGYFVYSLIRGNGTNKKREYIGTFLGGYVGVSLASLFAAIEFGIQPILFKDAAGMPLYCPYPISVSIPAMVIPHLLVVGIIEGLVTAGVYAYVKKTSPELMYSSDDKKVSIKPLYGLLAIMVVLSPLGLLASGTAWGEWGAEEIKSITGFVPRAMEKGFNFKALMQDYGVAGINSVSGYIISAIAGMLVLLIVFRIIGSKNESKSSKN